MTGAPSWARLTFRLQRSSIGFAAVVCLGLAALGAWLAMSLPSTLASCERPNAVDQCGTVYLFGSPMGDPALLFSLGVGVAMYAVPIVLGAPLVPSEVERRTAMIAWPLAGSRTKWLAWRAGSVLIIGVVLIGVMAGSAEAVAHANDPGTDLGFGSHGQRGVSLVLRGTLMLVVAMAVGAMVGRLLPALLVAGALAVGLSSGMEALPPYGVASTELTATEMSGYPDTTGHAYRAPDGTPISENQANAISIAAYAEYRPEFPPESILPIDVSYGVAGSRYFEVLAREAALILGATVAVGGVAALVVSRRRPE